MRQILSTISTVAGIVSILLWSSLAVAAPRAAVGQELPSFTLKALNPDVAGSAYVKTAHFVGNQGSKKAVLISFFATYCEPCKKEMPFLKALQDSYGDAGLQVVLVSIDTDAAEIEVAKGLAAKNGLTFPVLSDRFNIVAKRYQVAELPCVFTASEDGVVQTIHTGYGEGATQVMHDDVRKILGVAGDAPVPAPLAAFFAPPAVEQPKATALPTQGKKKKKKKKYRKRRTKQ